MVQATGSQHFLRLPGVAQQLQQHANRSGQRQQSAHPTLQVLPAAIARQVLPGEISRQIKLEGAARYAGAAADAHQPVVVCECLTHLTRQRIERREKAVELPDHFIQRILRNGRVAPVTIENMFLFFQVFEDFGF